MSRNKKEHNIGVFLILMVVIISAILSALNINETWGNRCKSGTPFVYNGESYTCKKIVK